MRINTNVASMTAQESASNVNKALNSSLEKLSSGLRINKASDDASGMAIADKLRTQASALGQSISNANSGNALVQIADKAMSEQSNILDIVKTKLIQAATETTSSEGRESIRKDIKKLLTQLDNIATQTNYNGINLLDTKGKDFTFQVGEDKAYDIAVSTAYASNTQGLGGGANKYTAITDDATKAALTLTGTTVSGVYDSISLKNTAASIVLSGDTAAGQGDINFTLTGSNVTSLTFTAGNFHVSDDATKTLLLGIASNGDNLDYNSTTNVFTIASVIDFTAAVDLGTLTFTAGVKASMGKGVTLTAGGSITVTNLGTTGFQFGASEYLTGGQLLSDLKSLSDGGLTNDKANLFMSTVDEALSQLNSVRSDFGSTQNQLDSFIRNAMTTQTNIKAAESVIRDVDYAAESANFNKQNIIAQAGTYALSQANSIQQNVLRLLQ